MAFFYIINGEGKYLGNIKGTKVLFHKPNSATFLHRQTREMIEKLKARVEGLGATDLTIMEAEDEESAKAYMITTYCNGEASVSSPKRGRPAGGVKKEKAKKPQKKIDLNGVQDEEEEDEYISQPEYTGEEEVEHTEDEKKYLKAISDPDVKAMFAKSNVNKKCMLCKRLCKQPSTSVIYQCPQFQYDEYRDDANNG